MFKSSDVVYTTTKINGIECLKTCRGNRMVNLKHVKEIQQQMLARPYIIPPITVNRLTHTIIDGQHRVEAFKNLMHDGTAVEDTLKVMWVELDPAEEFKAIIDANTHSKNWTLEDYISGYSDVSKDYRDLKEWCSVHPLCYVNKKDNTKKTTKGTYRYRFASAIIKGMSCQNILKEGNFYASPEEYAKAEVVYSEIEGLFDAMKCESKPTALEQVAINWHKVRRLHPIEVWKDMMKRRRSTLQRMPKDNGSNWENLFSYVNTQINLKEGGEE